MVRTVLIFLIEVLVAAGAVGYNYAGAYGLILEAIIVTAILVLVVLLVLDLRPKP